MAELVEVKVEPYDNDDIDYDEKLMRMQKQQETVFVAATSTAASPTTATVKVEDELIIKTEFEIKEEENSPLEELNPLTHVELDGMKVVDEQADIITVNAVVAKSEDEKKFMMNCLPKTKPARKRKQSFYQQTCAQCQQTFNQRRSYEQHIDFGLCTVLENKLRCSVCPLSFSSQVQLDTHLAMHQLNRFFCSKHCGKFFITLDDCKLHEYRQHKMRNIMCSICNHKFSSCNALIKHMPSHNTLKRFVCSYCRDWFSSSIDLAKHWQFYAQTCGKLMQNYSSTIESIESSLAVCNETTNNGRANATEQTLADYGLLSAKRAKVSSKECSKAQIASTPGYLSLGDIQIKEEPQTDHEIADDLQSLQTNATSTNESDTSNNVVIKSEPFDIEIKQEPYFADNYEMPLIPSLIDEATDPGFKVIPASTFLPLQQQTNGLLPKIPNLRLVRLPGLQTAPTIASAIPVPAIPAPAIPAPAIPAHAIPAPGIPAPAIPAPEIPSPAITAPAKQNYTIGLKPLQIQNQNIKLTPITLSGYKIFKIMPNAQLMRLPPVTLANTTTMTKSTSTPPIILKLKKTQSAKTAVSYTTINTVTTSVVSASTTPSIPITMPIAAAKTESNPIIVQLPSLATNTSIDADDLKRLVHEAAAAKNAVVGNVRPTRKNICKTKQELEMIEKIPQKRVLIENWKQQVKQFETPVHDSKEVENLSNVETKYDSKHDSKHESKLDQNHDPKQVPKLEPTQEPTTNAIKKENLYESFEILSVLENTVEIKKESSPKNADEIGNHNYDEDDDDDEYDSKSLIIDEGDESEEDYANNSNSSFSIQTDHSQPAPAAASAASGEITASPQAPTFYLPVTSDCDPELQAARKQYSHLRYQWRCPHCPRSYTQKHCFRGHLVSAHGLCQEEFVKLIVEVRPNECAKSLEELKKSPNILPQSHSESETESNATIDSSIKQTVKEFKSSIDKADKKPYGSKLTCAKCGRTCSTRTALNDHVLANCSREPQYPCTICTKRFFSASTLNQHMSIHTGALPHKCSYCDKHFRTRGQVTVHHRTHTGERPFECQVCGQRFTHRETLISHLSRHIGMKRYKCYGCNQQFACISGLKTHREVRYSSCGKVKLNTRAIGPRVRVIKGNVIFEAQPEINPYLRTDDPQEVLAEVQDIEKS